MTSKPRRMTPPARIERLAELLGLVVAAAGEAGFARADGLVHGGDSLVDRRVGVEGVIHVYVHEVGLQAFEAGVERFGYVSVVVVGGHLGAKHDLVAATASLEPAPDDHFGGVGFAADLAVVIGAEVVAPVLLGLGSAVGFGGIEQRDAVFDGRGP